MKKVFILLLMPAAMFMGCSKNNDSAPSGEENCGVSKIIDNHEEWTFEYDDKGQVSVVNERRDEGDWGVYYTSYKFSYFNDRLEIKLYNGDELKTEYEYKLDATGKIRTGLVKSVHPLTSSYSYNDEGYLTKETTNAEEGTITLELTYNNENIEKRIFKYGSHVGEKSFSYNLNESNYPYSAHFTDMLEETFMDMYKQVLYEQGYFGKKSKNQPIKGGSRTFTYSKNLQNKINRINLKDSDTGGSRERTIFIEYQCD